MKSLPAFLPRLLAVAFLTLATLAAAPRTEINLNTGWRFHYGDTPGAEAPSFDTTAWSSVNTPHTWNALDGQDGVQKSTATADGAANIMKGGDYARGTGWYRRTLAFEPAWAGRQVYLQFDGANRRADVFLNGRLIGIHLGGNARFRFDLTAALRPGAPNLLAVRVNNEDNGILPHSADFTFFGGLYRDVALLITDPVQVETMDHASPGVYLTPTRVSPERAEVSARVKLANHTASPAGAAVRITVLDAAGQTVVDANAAAPLAAGAHDEITLPLALARPHLWNGRADPYLYTTRIEVTLDGTVRDTVE